MTVLQVLPLTADAFAPYGQVISTPATPNETGKAQMWKQVGALEFQGAGPSVDVLYSPPRSLQIDGMERHLNSTQAFFPLLPHPFIVVVAPADADDSSGVDHSRALAFVSDGRSGVNFAVGIWHCSLLPLEQAQCFAIVHRSFENGLHGEFVKFRNGALIQLEL